MIEDNKERENRLKIALVAALQLEPMINKPGAVSFNHSYNQKKFHEFVLASSLIATIINTADILRKPYQTLYETVQLNEIYFGNNRFWGAIGLLFPIATATYLQIPFLTFLEDHTTKEDVDYLNNARIATWRTSKKQYKREYQPIPADNVLEHYRALYIYGKEREKSLITSWTEEILAGLPIALSLYRQCRNKPIERVLHRIIPSTWDILKRYYSFTIGQAADFVAVALFLYLFDSIGKKNIKKNNGESKKSEKKIEIVRNWNKCLYCKKKLKANHTQFCSRKCKGLYKPPDGLTRGQRHYLHDLLKDFKWDDYFPIKILKNKKVK